MNEEPVIISKSKILRVFLAFFLTLFGLSTLFGTKGGAEVFLSAILYPLVNLGFMRGWGAAIVFFLGATSAALGFTLMWLWLVKRD